MLHGRHDTDRASVYNRAPGGGHVVDNRNRNTTRAKEQFGDSAVADAIQRLESRIEAERFFTKFYQIWDLSEEDGMDDTDSDNVNMRDVDLDDVVRVADEIGQLTTRQRTEHASEIRRHITELKAMIKGR